jgi:GDSL-like lipase/acylhydrolase family protein
MAELARAHGVRVIFSSILPVHNYTPGSQENFELRPPEKIVALNRSLERYCRANDNVYLDYFSAMVDEHGLMRRELADKGLHPNPAATQSWPRWPRGPSSSRWPGRASRPRRPRRDNLLEINRAAARYR